MRYPKSLGSFLGGLYFIFFYFTCFTLEIKENEKLVKIYSSLKSGNWFYDIFKTLYVYFLICKNNFKEDILGPEKISNTLQCLTYTHNGGDKIVLIKSRRKKMLGVRNIKNEHGEDITHRILKFAGPDGKFNSLEVTPKDFGIKFLIIEYKNAEIKNFDENSKIII